MSTMNISIPESLRVHVEQKVKKYFRLFNHRNDKQQQNSVDVETGWK